jgi:ATP-dependent RNA helicase DDX10/DBP4
LGSGEEEGLAFGFARRGSGRAEVSNDGFKGRQETKVQQTVRLIENSALAKLSLHDPLYINCNKPGEEGVVPANLEQFYAVVGLERKLDALWGFVKSHLK